MSSSGRSIFLPEPVEAKRPPPSQDAVPYVNTVFPIEVYADDRPVNTHECVGPSCHHCFVAMSERARREYYIREAAFTNMACERCFPKYKKYASGRLEGRSCGFCRDAWERTRHRSLQQLRGAALAEEAGPCALCFADPYLAPDHKAPMLRRWGDCAYCDDRRTAAGARRQI